LNASAISAALSGSAARMAAIIASEKTTPQPNVSSGRLRSSTAIRASGRASFMTIEKNRPAGPPPMQTMFTTPPQPRRTRQPLRRR
jgi:hypothetical protein